MYILYRRVAEKSSAIEALFSTYAVAEIKPVVMEATDRTISGAEIALIVIAVLIFFGAIVGAIVILCSSAK